MATQVTYKPFHAEEFALMGATFEHPVDFAFTRGDGTVTTQNDTVSIFVPKSVRDRNDKEVGVANDVFVFFTANDATLDTRLNDTLTHALRAAGDAQGFVIITLPSPGDHPDVLNNMPDFNVIRDTDIEDCLDAVKLSKKIGRVRLACHSRGHQGMTRTLMGNDQIGDTPATLAQRDPNTAKINTSFVDIKRIDKITYFDNFYPSGHRILGTLVTRGLSNTALKVYQVTAGVSITNTAIVNDIKTQYVMLAVGSKSGGHATSPEQDKIAAIGCMRFISNALSVTAASTLDTTFSQKVMSNTDVLTPLILSRLPPRGTFSSLPTTPPNAVDYVTYIKSLVISAKQMSALLDFLNKERLIRTTYTFDSFIAAHHFFVCEFVHELFV